MSKQSQLFPSIGSLAEQTENLPENLEGTRGEIVPFGDDEDRPLQEIESLCMNCGEQGITRMMLTSIPFFREIVVMSFRCEHCNFHNNEIQSAGTIRPEGTIYTARILSRDDLNRQIVKSPNCTVVIPEQELTIPPGRGQLTTVEGLLRDIVIDLGAQQPLRCIQDPAAYTKIQTIIDTFKDIIQDHDDDESDEKQELPPMPPFTVKLDDPSGTSFLEFVDSMADPKWNMRTYHRTRQQNVDLGLVAEEESAVTDVSAENESDAIAKAKQAIRQATEIGGPDDNEEIFVFPGVCSSCGHPLDTLMKRVIIPYFKDILIMSTNCDHCGYRDNEVKSGSAISDRGKRIVLKVEDRDDLSRDILKSETCGLTIPEIDLVLQAGTLGGRFTTLEGILDQVYEELSDKVFASGDSAGTEDRKTFEDFLKSLKEIKNVEKPFTLILDDPLANSYLQNLYAPDPDPNMEMETYDRTFEQNEELGLNDMKVEGYEEDVQASAP
ncbi:hypothetical protein JAAARDRAFT_150522 [Jaapia argillacea MUCL 33604]|uniref:Zinc finger ZPR1-type domain-containing protein n=1 Tax=Jaapia argillacea MUCL 33604 TaxID=933084 RepID=A0A067Q642_9AGAM|nr:hypothetical protein JAAARDRAFT_150522 [Jaapia argillacea MUCL 33604]